MHTIIGATPFHGPVRDGKGWVQSAIAAKRNRNLEEVNFNGLNHIYLNNLQTYRMILITT
jgi:hypothetical protein